LNHWFPQPKHDCSVFEGSYFFQTIIKILARFQAVSSFNQSRILEVSQGLLSLLLFFSIFMPQFYFGSIGLSRVDFRGEDLILPILVILIPLILIQKTPLVEFPSVEKAFLVFFLIAEVSILNGLFFRTIDKPFLSLLYLIKWLEYFLVFAITTRLTVNGRSLDLFLKAFFFLGIMIAIYGYWERFFVASKAAYPDHYRLFERFPFHGNANHIGGLLVFWICFFIGILINMKHRLNQTGLAAALLFVFFPLLWTYSRTSYVALGAPLFCSVFVFSKSRYKILFFIFLFIFVALVLPTGVWERLTYTATFLTSTDPYHSSWACRLVMWRQALWNFQHFFLFGSGFGSRHRLYYESQYVQVLAETGIVGFISFVFLCSTLVREFTFFLRQKLAARDRGMLLGWLMGFCGLLIHSIFCVSWTVAKIAIPFWFLTGVVLAYLKHHVEISLPILEFKH